MDINNINISYNNTIIYKDFNIHIEDNKINCIVGPSGCGKTTLLNYLAKHFINRKIDIGFIFQEDRLIPWKNIYENLYLISKGYYDKDTAKEKVIKVLGDLELIEFRNLYPNQLSGGMKQKINIARALISRVEMLIMDEPFKSIDEKGKIKIIKFIKNKIIKEKLTVIFVSHDKEEVNLLSDRVIILGEKPVKIIKKYDIQENFSY